MMECTIIATLREKGKGARSTVHMQVYCGLCTATLVHTSAIHLSHTPIEALCQMMQECGTSNASVLDVQTFLNTDLWHRVVHAE